MPRRAPRAALVIRSEGSVEGADIGVSVMSILRLEMTEGTGPVQRMEGGRIAGGTLTFDVITKEGDRFEAVFVR